MKLLPYYKEEGGAKFSGSISLKQNIEVLSIEDASLIAGYMSSCIVIDDWLSNVEDIFTHQLVIPSKTWSDGTYIWDSSHIYYIKEYRARLPKNFISHVKKQLNSNFDPTLLKVDILKTEFEALLQKVAAGDESYYEGSY